MKINKKIKSFFSALPLLLWMLVGLSACSTDSSERMQEEPAEEFCYTYSMRLNSSFEDYGNGTRAAHSWSDDSKLYLQFFEGENRITGAATFNLVEDAWTVSTSKPLTAPDGAYCEVYYFVNPSAALSTTVSMDLKTVTYGDKNGSYTLEEDDAIAVTASLSPLTGRIRFVGTQGTTYTVSGLSTYANYSVSTNTFTPSSRKLSVTIGEDGSSDYYYALFEDESQLVVNGEGKSAYLRTFADHVLTAGSSGFVTLPSADELGAWALVNADNLQEITLPEVSGVTVSTIRSKSAGVTATVTALGNGTLLESGIVCSTNSTPTLDNGTRYDGAKSKTVTLRVKSLQPETYYYVCAYARNERGITWGETVSFKTISEAEEGNAIYRDDFGEDDDLNDYISSEGTDFDREGFGEEDDLNTEVSTSGSGFDKGAFTDDDDLNVSVSTNGSGFSRDDFTDDDNLNVSVSTNGSGFGKDGFTDDDNLNVSVSTNSSGFGKGGYDTDEDWN